MKQNDDGTFEIAPKERICIKVTKTQAPYLATFSDPDCTPWSSVTTPDPLTGIRCFIAPTTVCTWCFIEIVFEFVKNDQGNYDPSDKYIVVISGESGPPSGDTVAPPPPQGRPYRFHVSNP